MESSREQEELFLQQLDWQKHMKFIGIKFELEEKHLEHCFHDEKYHFQIFQSGTEMFALFICQCTVSGCDSSAVEHRASDGKIASPWFDS